MHTTHTIRHLILTIAVATVSAAAWTILASLTDPPPAAADPASTVDDPPPPSPRGAVASPVVPAPRATPHAPCPPSTPDSAGHHTAIPGNPAPASGHIEAALPRCHWTPTGATSRTVRRPADHANGRTTRPRIPSG